MGYEKFIMDIEQAGMIHAFTKGIDLSENGFGLDAIREIGPGNHFLGSAHTQENFENAFYRSDLSDNNSFEQWEAEGALDMAQRAQVKWKSMLETYEIPSIDPSVDEALQAYMNKRKDSFPDQNY